MRVTVTDPSARLAELEHAARLLLDALQADPNWTKVSLRTFSATQRVEEALGMWPPFEIPTEEAPGGALGPFGPKPVGWAT